jgi:histone deacetylase 6
MCDGSSESIAYANKSKADCMKHYIGWAIGKGYAVIDVNIPKHVTTEPVSNMTFV